MEKFKHNKTLFAAVLLLLLATSVYAVSPKVVKTVPQNGDDNIRPGLRRIEILFDQDMDRQGHSVCGGGPTFPEIVGKPRWTDKRTFMMSAKLKPSTEYELYVNSPSYKNFKNLQGEPAVVYHLKFKTAAVKGKAPGAGKSPAILLQKARYAEETEGDLDKAIELYRQAIDRAGQIQRIAAQATYQLAMCYLKKGEKKKAIEYLGLVSNYPTQKAIVEKAKQQLKELKPEKVDSVFEQMSYQVMMFIAEKYGKLAAEAGARSLFCNAHIYCVDPDLAVYSGGLGYHYNWRGHSLTGKVRLSGTSYPNQTLYDTNGQKLNTEIVPDKDRNNFYHIYWIPEEPLKPQEALYYGWSRNDKRKLSPLPGSGKGILTMQNQYGPKVLETFFLVLPPELAIAQDVAPTDSHDFGDYNVFWWTKEVPQNANHVENVMIQKAGKITDPNAISDVVSNVILTISTCAESDPRVGQSLKKLKSVDDKAALAEIGKYLDSEKPTVRRSAIFVCWRGGFDNIGPVEEKLMKLCSHKESFTRGMSAITLGAGKVGSSFETLTDMTLHDNDGYARRCAAYALGLYGDKKAIGVLEKALEDKDLMVKQNAEAALRMLRLKSSKAGPVANPIANNKKKAEDLTAQGWKLWGQRKLAEAEEKFKQATEKDPTDNNAYQGLGWAQLNQGKKLNAKNSFEECIKLNPKNSAALNGLGWISHGQGNIDEAIKWWQKAVEANPGATASLNGLTKVYMEKKEYDKAIKYYEMWLKAEPDNKQAKEGMEKAKASNKI